MRYSAINKIKLMTNENTIIRKYQNSVLRAYVLRHLKYIHIFIISVLSIRK